MATLRDEIVSHVSWKAYLSIKIGFFFIWLCDLKQWCDEWCWKKMETRRKTARIELKFPHDIPLFLFLSFYPLQCDSITIKSFISLLFMHILFSSLFWHLDRGRMEVRRKNFHGAILVEEFYCVHIYCLFLFFFFRLSFSMNLNKNQIEGGDVEDIDVNNSKTMSIT